MKNRATIMMSLVWFIALIDSPFVIEKPSIENPNE